MVRSAPTQPKNKNEGVTAYTEPMDIPIQTQHINEGVTIPIVKETTIKVATENSMVDEGDVVEEMVISKEGTVPTPLKSPQSKCSQIRSKEHSAVKSTQDISAKFRYSNYFSMLSDSVL